MNSSPGFSDDVLESAMSALYSTSKVGSSELAHSSEEQWMARTAHCPRYVQLKPLEGAPTYRFRNISKTDDEERGALSQLRPPSLRLNPFCSSAFLPREARCR